MFGQCLVPSITKKVISYSGVLGQQHLYSFKRKSFNEVFQYISKSFETFLIRNHFYNNAKKQIRQKKRNKF